MNRLTSLHLATLLALASADFCFAQTPAAPIAQPPAPIAAPAAPLKPAALAPKVVAAQQAASKTQIEKPQGLQFSFDRSPWRFVIDWLAEEAGVAVHVSDLPTGSFTYADQKTYTPDEAIGRINLFLIPQRYSIVRTDNLLSVINLDDETSVRQLDAMAKSVPLAELERVNDHDVVKCIFPLGELESDAVLQEIAGLMLIRDPVLLKNTNGLLLTDTARKLRLVNKVISSLAKVTIDQEGPILRYSYGNLDPERVLAQIRPHVGLDPLASLGTDISLSVDREGRLILASGTKDMLDKVKSVIDSLNTGETKMPAAKQQFRSHPLGDADMQTVVSVLQTLLADDDVRLAPDPKTNQLAVLAEESVHQIVSKTIEQLAGDNRTEFRAIDLGDIDPRYAVTVLSGMFNVRRPSTEDEDSKAVADPKAIKVEPDYFTNRLFVRGTANQIAEIEQAISQLGTSGGKNTEESNVRLLPYHGQRAMEIIESATQFWPHDERVIVIPTAGASAPRSIEREINPQAATSKQTEGSQPKPVRQKSTPADTQALKGRSASLTLATHTNKTLAKADGSEIKVQWTPRGILVHSGNSKALDRFEQHLRLIAGPANESTMKLSIFYLKNVDSEVASQLLQDILDAEYYGRLSDSPFAFDESFASALSGVVGGSVPAGLEDYWTSGSTTVIPDKRLNRIFVYATVEELASIEQHLTVIDRESSIASVKTYGTPRIVRLEHANATDVSDVVRDAYAGRVADTDEQRRAAEKQRREAAAKGKPLAKEPPSSQTTAPKMTIAVNEQTNSIVVTAPEQLSKEVEQLIKSIDKEATTSISVRSLPNDSVHDLLLGLLTDEEPSSSTKKAK